MRAIVAAEHGGSEVLKIGERPAPTAGPGQLVVDVAAAGINYRDVYEREGRPAYAGPTPFVPGVEGAGVVTEVGPGVSDVAAGDRVAWVSAPGSYAEQVVVAADRAVPVPPGVDLQIAAAALLQGMTAHYLAYDTFPVQSGDHAVVHAAAGGVGLTLTQLVKLRGGVVVATASTAAKAELARAAGADHLAGYDDFAAVARELTGGAGAAVVYDGVGQATFEAGLTALRLRGYLVLYGAASGPVPPFDLQRLPGLGSLFLTRPTLASYVATRADLLRRAGAVLGLVADGRLDVRIGAAYPLAAAAQAHADLEARRTTGKLLLIPG
jgi:NADPH2:quinone reductase